MQSLRLSEGGLLLHLAAGDEKQLSRIYMLCSGDDSEHSNNFITLSLLQHAECIPW